MQKPDKLESLVCNFDRGKKNIIYNSYAQHLEECSKMGVK